LGAVVKDAKEQLRSLPDGLTYGALRYLNADVDLCGADPSIGFNYLGRAGAVRGDASGDIWEVRHDAWSVTGAAAAVAMPLMHTLELSAATVDTEAGPRLRAGWMWAASALDHAQVDRLSQLWFDALAGICALVRAGGGGLTPSDIAPARLGQQQIDELCLRYPVTDILPLTPLQQGLLFHADVAHSCGDDVYAVQLDVALSGRLDQRRLRNALQAVVIRHPNLVAQFSQQFAEPVQILPADPVVPWRYVELDRDDAAVDVEAQVAQVLAAERAAVIDLADQPGFRATLFRVSANEYRFVLTNHHIVLDGWSLPILLGEVFAQYYGQRLGAAVPYRRFTEWLAARDVEAARAAWGEVLSGFDAPTLVAPVDASRSGPRNVIAVRVSQQTTAGLGELARSAQTTVATVLQAGFAQLLMSLTGQHDVAFGAVVSGRPAELAGADSMVGLLINTVPVRATATATTTTADLLVQLHDGHNRTLDHEHLGLNEIHRVSGHRRLFDTAFVYENYPSDAATLAGADGLAITGLSNRDHYHYPLTIQAVPGEELDLRVQYRTDVFDETSIEALIDRFQEILVSMTTDSTGPITPTATAVTPHATTTSASAPAHHDDDGTGALTEGILIEIFAQVLGVDSVGIDESFFDLGGDSLLAMRAIAAINTALHTDVPVTAIFDARTARSLSGQLGTHVNPAEVVPAVGLASDQ
jgi:non-ribosomal peptide synthase protein (TIGR01720 family)